ncbi:winged helix-turn-helix transcriptional regulator [Cytobacillus spongiae]|uniref:winged helix-turn-helix transcriptional regulator n=1 Tax=Cytobacillus spongiae TaxID=2901381 RepID=UPI001F2191D4|nr:winged helix-turn-helix transcriptional regulator [Cytobacillus spongiae]UII56261.1 winged helix-turn-helix transcriptional regulator [Cytobacillus spongiae]
MIRWHLAFDGKYRYNELRRLSQALPITCVVSSLRSLNKEELIVRKPFDVIPPKVEYSISEKGFKLKPL